MSQSNAIVEDKNFRQPSSRTIDKINMAANLSALVCPLLLDDDVTSSDDSDDEILRLAAVVLSDKLHRKRSTYYNFLES